MKFSLDPNFFLAFSLALIRAGAWVSTCPPWSATMVPARVKIGFAAVLALAAAPHLNPAQLPTDGVSFLAAAVIEAVIGASMGFVATLMFAAFQSAGGIIDFLGQFSMAQILDPMSGQMNAVMARMFQLLFTAFLFASGGYLLIVKGFLTSFEVQSSGMDMGAFGRLLVSDFSSMFVAAVELAAPVAAALFVAEVALGLLVRAAPTINVLIEGLPIKILLTFFLVGGSLSLFPGMVDTIVGQTVRSMLAAARYLSGGG